MKLDYFKVTILGTFTSLAISALRLALGRDAAASDMALNALGTACGHLLAQLPAITHAGRAPKKSSVPIDSLPI
jgi:VanZ family protein